MKLTRTFLVSHKSLLSGIAVVAATTVVACSAEEKKDAWTCGASDVPMGEVVRCTQSALTLDAPAIDYNVAVTTPTVVYECNAGESECPPAVLEGDQEPCTGANDNPDLCPPSGSSSDDGSSATGGNGNGNGNGSGAGGNGNGGGKGSHAGGSSERPGPDECAYVPELPYCSSPGGSSSGDGSSQGGSSLPPGQDKKGDGSGSGSGGSSDGSGSDGSGSSQGGSGSDGSGSDGSGSTQGGSSSDGSGSTQGGSSSGGKGKKGTHYVCTKDDKGNKTCESTPECATGTHPSACGACVADGDTDDCVPPSEGGCWVTGGGFIVAPNLTTGAEADGHDNFGGNAKPMKDGRIQGHWNHVDHGTGNHAKGKPEYIVCRHVDEPGPGQPGGKKGFTMNQVYFGGHAEWRSNDVWESGYWFDVVAKDHGEPGSVPHVKNGFMVDTYHFTIRKMDDPVKLVSGAIVYETKGDLQGGNIQLHPPNPGHPYTPGTLPTWVAYEP